MYPKTIVVDLQLYTTDYTEKTAIVLSTSLQKGFVSPEHYTQQLLNSGEDVSLLSFLETHTPKHSLCDQFEISPKYSCLPIYNILISNTI